MVTWEKHRPISFRRYFCHHTSPLAVGHRPLSVAQIFEALAKEELVPQRLDAQDLVAGGQRSDVIFFFNIELSSYAICASIINIQYITISKNIV